jgi:hypothetical protein
MARARGKGALIFCDVTRSLTSQKQFSKKQKTNKMATIKQKVDHLNKLTMIAMTSEDAHLLSANKEVCEFVNSLKSEGYNICEGDELDIYTDYEMHVIDRLTALISQSMSADEVIHYGMADDGEELELDQFYSYMSDSEIGLLECRVKNPEGIRFFYLDGDDITLKKAPYFHFQDCIMYKVGLYPSEPAFKTKEYLEMADNIAWDKNPLDD